MKSPRSFSAVVLALLSALLLSHAGTFGLAVSSSEEEELTSSESALSPMSPRRHRHLISVVDCTGSGSDQLCVNADVDATGNLLGCSVSYGGSNCTCTQCTTSDSKAGFSYDCSQVSTSGNGTSSNGGGGGPTMACMEFSEHAGGTPTSSSPPTRLSSVGAVVTSLAGLLAVVVTLQPWLVL